MLCSKIRCYIKMGELHMKQFKVTWNTWLISSRFHVSTPTQKTNENCSWQHDLPVASGYEHSYSLPYLLHRNPEYFPDPDKFDPNRFLPEEVAKHHSYSFIPFSGGPPNCLGLKFAMLEMKVVVAYLLRHFVISTSNKLENIPLLPNTTLTPAKDSTFRFKKRSL